MSATGYAHATLGDLREFGSMGILKVSWPRGSSLVRDDSQAQNGSGWYGAAAQACQETSLASFQSSSRL